VYRSLLVLQILLSTPLLFFLQRHPPPLDLPSFPTRRSSDLLDAAVQAVAARDESDQENPLAAVRRSQNGGAAHALARVFGTAPRSEEHTSELQSLRHLVCRLLLEKKKNIRPKPNSHTIWSDN